MQILIKSVELLSAGTAVVIAFVVIFGYFQIGVPVFEVKEHCDPTIPDENATSEEIIYETASRLWEFYRSVNAFGLEHDGRLAYLDIEIEASSSSLGCAMLDGFFAQSIGDEDAEPHFWMRFEDDPWNSEFSFTLRGPEAGFWELSIPAIQKELPRNGQYRVMEYGHILSIEGPFFVDYQDKNGFAKVTFYPQFERVFSEAEISCARKRLDAPGWARAVLPCF